METKTASTRSDLLAAALKENRALKEALKGALDSKYSAVNLVSRIIEMEDEVADLRQQINDADVVYTIPEG